MEIPRGDLDLGPIEHDAAAVITRLGWWAFAGTMAGRVGFRHGQTSRHAAIARVGADLVAAAAGQVEVVDVGDGIELGRPVPELLGDKMDNFLFALYTAAHAQQTRTHDDAAMRIEHLGPDHEVGDPMVILDGDEHPAGSGAWPLAPNPQPCKGE